MRFQGRSQKKFMTEAMSMVKFSSQVFRVFMMTTFKQKRKKMTEASASVCLLLTTALGSDWLRVFKSKYIFLRRHSITMSNEALRCSVLTCLHFFIFHLFNKFLWEIALA